MSNDRQTPSREALIESIYQTFEDFALPFSATNHPGCCECDGYAEELAGVQRQDLTMLHIGTVCWGPIPFLTPAAMAYYFPRLAEFAILNAENKEGDPFRFQFLGALRDAKAKQFTLFEGKHRLAVLEVLTFLEKERTLASDDDDTGLDTLDSVVTSWKNTLNSES